MRAASFLALALLLVPCSSASARSVQADLEPLDHAALSARLAELAGAHPDAASLHRVAISREGRAVEALRLTTATDPSAPPALLLVGNLEGPRLFESAVVLDHAATILARAQEPAVAELLATTVLWFVPRANPDAAEARFLEPRHERWTATTGVDNDRDGRSGEDPAADVNGDGLVTRMRVPDPEGAWRPDPADPRAMVKADRDKGERGEFALHVESRDLDGDEEPGEDPPGDTRLDRNFPSGWEEHAPHAGLFPTDEPEVRGLCELVMAQRNLVLVVTYDGRSNLHGKPESVADDAQPVKRVPKPGLLASDAALVEELGERYREAVEARGEPVEGSSDAGTFGRWCYDHRGLVTLETVLWSLPDEPVPAEPEEAEEPEETEASENAASEPEEAPEEKGAEPKPSADAKHLAWIDSAGEGWRFVDWTPFEHPELGPVEIGGFAPFARLEPPVDDRRTIADEHLAWFLGLGERLPRVAFASCTMERLGEGEGSALWRVEAVLANEGFLPALSRSARRTRTTRPLRVRLVLPEAAELVAGRVQELVEDLPGSGGRHELTWLVKGPPGLEVGVSFDSDHLGEGNATAEVIR